MQHLGKCGCCGGHPKWANLGWPPHILVLNSLAALLLIHRQHCRVRCWPSNSFEAKMVKTWHAAQWTVVPSDRVARVLPCRPMWGNTPPSERCAKPVSDVSNPRGATGVESLAPPLQAHAAISYVS